MVPICTTFLTCKSGAGRERRNIFVRSANVDSFRKRTLEYDLEWLSLNITSRSMAPEKFRRTFNPYDWLKRVDTEYFFRYEGYQTVPPCFAEAVH